MLLRFDAFELDAGSLELRQGGRRIRLPRQSLVVLALLASRPGQVVGRDELRRALWPDGTFVDFDGSLNFSVRRLRRALGDPARAPRFVETVPREGYRFVAPVERVEIVAPVAAPRAEPRRLPWAVAMLSVVLAFQGATTAHTSVAGQPGLSSPDRAAQAAFDRGRALLDEGPTGWRRSIASFEDASRRDPGFALARYGLADAWIRMAEGGVLDPDTAFPAARTAALAALQIEDRAEPRLVLAAVRLHYERDWTAARSELEHALRLDPRLLSGHRAYAFLLSASGEHDAALRAIRRAEALEPACAELVDDVGWCCYRARRYDEAVREWRRFAEMEPADPRPHHFLVLALRAAGREREAAAEARTVLALSKSPARFQEEFARLEPKDALDRYLAGSARYLRGLASSGQRVTTDLARILADVGETGEALQLLDRAEAAHDPSLLPALLDPDLDALRDEPAFQRLAVRVGARAALNGRLPAGVTVAALQ